MDEYNRKNQEPYWWSRFKYKVRKFVTNPDIACGFFWGAAFTSALWLVIQIYVEQGL
jgi:hypothetical protein